jgi:hypothetical protein
LLADTCRLKRDTASFGLSIAGGAETKTGTIYIRSIKPGTPYYQPTLEDKSGGIGTSQLVPADSAAAESEALNVHDRLIAVNENLYVTGPTPIYSSGLQHIIP